MQDKIKFSIVVPVFNEEGNIKITYKKLKIFLDSLNECYEIIFINDGSTDKSLDILKDIKKVCDRIKVISLNKSYGQTVALAFGFYYANGDSVITIDADLQYAIQDIKRLLFRLEEGYDLVSGWRKHRKDQFFNKVLPSIIANKLIAFLFRTNLHDVGCNFRVYKKELAKKIGLYSQMHRLIPILAILRGFKVSEVEVRHYPRQLGKSKYGWRRIGITICDVAALKFATFNKNRQPSHFLGIEHDFF